VAAEQEIELAGLARLGEEVVEAGVHCRLNEEEGRETVVSLPSSVRVFAWGRFLTCLEKKAG